MLARPYVLVPVPPEERVREAMLMHLGEAGASLLLLMAKSRHKKPENLRRYFKPSGEAVAEVASLLAPATADAEAQSADGLAM